MPSCRHFQNDQPAHRLRGSSPFIIGLPRAVAVVAAVTALGPTLAREEEDVEFLSLYSVPLFQRYICHLPAALLLPCFSDNLSACSYCMHCVCSSVRSDACDGWDRERCTPLETGCICVLAIICVFVSSDLVPLRRLSCLNRSGSPSPSCAVSTAHVRCDHCFFVGQMPAS